MKPGKTAKTILIAAIGLIGSAGIVACSSLVLHRLVEHAMPSETDTAVADTVSAAVTAQSVTSLTSIAVSDSDGSITVIGIVPDGTGAVLSVTVTDKAGNVLSAGGKPIDATVFEQLTTAVSAYRLTKYAVRGTSADAGSPALLFTCGDTGYVLSLPAADEQAAAGAEAVNDIIAYYLG